MAGISRAEGPYTRADIINAVQALVPPPTAFVPDLIRAQLPTVIPEDKMKAIPANCCLVKALTSGSLPEVLGMEIPHKTWLASLRDGLEMVGRLHPASVTAIKHPTVSDLYLPLWALDVWDSIAVACQERMRWVQATEWLEPDQHRAEDMEAIESARSIMAKIPWGMMAWALPGSDGASLPGFLARFLSLSWLAERNIDLMGVRCNAIAAADPARSNNHVAIVYLGLQLQGIGKWNDEKIQSNKDLHGWKALAAEKELRYIHIPVNLDNSHWVIFCVDLDKKTFCWGQSLASTCSHFPC